MPDNHTEMALQSASANLSQGLKNQRDGVRRQIGNLWKKISPMLDGQIAYDEWELTKAHRELEIYAPQLQDLDRQLLGYVDDQADRDSEMDNAGDYNDDVMDKMFHIQKKMTDHALAVTGTSGSSQSPPGAPPSRTQQGQGNFKLPKFEMATFNGDPMKWRGWFEVYKSAIHDNPSMTASQKFTYLLGYLKGPALKMASDYELNEENYKQVIEELIERFGDKQRAQFAHFEALFSIEKAKSDSLSEVQRVSDECERHIRSLTALEMDEEKFCVCFIPILLKKLPTYLATKICEKNGAGKWSMSNVRQWIKDDIRAREVGESATKGGTGFGSSNGWNKEHKKEWPQKSWQQQNFKQHNTTSSLAAPAQGKQKNVYCMFCQTPTHYSSECKKFRDAEARVAVLKSLRPAVCFVCFDSRCRNRNMCQKANKACFFCKRPGHHASLCRTEFPSENRAPPPRGKGWSGHPGGAGKSGSGPSDKRDTPKKESANVAVAQADDEVRDVAFLPTAMVTALNEAGTRTAPGRALTDSASSRSYITERLCRKLDLENVGSTYLSIGKFGSNKRSTTMTKRVRFKIECADGSKQTVLANVTPIISCPVSRYPIDPEKYPEMKNMKLGEPLSTRPDSLELDILIGSDQMFNFIDPTDVVDTGKGLVFLGSRLGYLTAGVMPARQGDPICENTLVLLLTEAAPGEMGSEMFDLERFWKLEEAGTVNKKSIQAVEDVEAVKQFDETVKFEDGRYQVTWPWKEKDPVLPDNYELAFARLQSTWKRLQKDEKLFKEYDDIIQDQKERGVLEKAPALPEGKVYHLPHHPHIVPTRSTTKVRIVNDASSKTSKNVNSLNDCILRGQVLIEDLCGCLMRFRMNPIALVSDIEKAFLQVGLQPQERDVARFLWLKDVSKPPTRDNVETLRFARVFFGAISSPFLLGATLNHHLKIQKSDIAEKIRTNIYVDNVITGEDSEDETVAHYRKARGLFLGATMNLREFFTNSDNVRREFASEDCGKGSETKVLGLKWKCTDDTLSCCGLKEIQTTGVTKREIMRQTAQLFDPCGFFAPVVLPGKLIVQEIWRLNLAWDEPVPEDVREKWSKVRRELQKIPLYALDRCVGDPGANLELHVFCDASAVAAGAAVYLRKVRSQTAQCDLLMAKSRVAPYKPVETIPRMELVALEMGVNLVRFVEQQLRLKDDVKIYAWGDSQCVLSWLTKEKLPTRFVKNRIENIRKNASGIEFRYVPSKENPADVCSRGCAFEAPAEQTMWWKGPPWLTKTEDFWPANRNPVGELLEKELPEPVTQLVSSQGPAEQPTKAITDPQRFSSLSKLLRVTAYVKRFVKNVRSLANNRKDGTLSVQEIADARVYWEKLVQKQGFSEVPAVLTEKGVKRGPLAQLNVFRDGIGILRCDTRLDKSGLPYDTRKPILLPKNHPFTDLVIREYHVTALHPGTAQTLSMIRQRYWVVHGRNQVRRVIRKCRRCRRIEGGPFAVPRIPALPEFRVTEQLPFAATGLDYLGFLNVRVDRNHFKKVWVCLFTCAVTRALHLELVEDQSSEEFHLAMRRFFAAQGTPKLIVSDNASQFTTVEVAMKKMWKELTNTTAFEEFVGTRSIEWKKIPQVAPWMGGFYERLVGVVKKFLKKALDGVCASPSELRTVLAEIQAIVNSRPLLYVEEGATSLQICPADLLGQTGRHDLPTYDEKDVPKTSTTVNNVVSSWKRLQAITINFWEIWRQGYLTSLRERQVSLRQRNPSELTPKIGCVVQIKDEKMPRAQWKLGKVEELHESGDGKVRSVTLRQGNGRSVTRPVKSLYPLEMHMDDFDESEDLESLEGISDPTANSEAPPEVDNPVLADEDDFWGFDDEDFGVLTDKIADIDDQIRHIASDSDKKPISPSPRASKAKNGPKSAENPSPRVADPSKLGPRSAKIVALAKLRRGQSVGGSEQA